MSKLLVLLHEDVAGQGRKGELVSVSEGYARNFIVKNKKGIIATPEELKKLENKKKKEEQRAAEDKLKAVGVKELLESKPVVVKVKVGDNGKVFGAVTNKEVAAEILTTFGLDIDKKKIECNIKTLGDNSATVKLHTEVKAEVKVVTVPMK